MGGCLVQNHAFGQLPGKARVSYIPSHVQRYADGIRGRNNLAEQAPFRLEWSFASCVSGAISWQGRSVLLGKYDIVSDRTRKQKPNTYIRTGIRGCGCEELHLVLRWVADLLAL